MGDREHSDGDSDADADSESDADRAARFERYRRRVEALPDEGVSPAFPPVEPADRPDPYNAFVTTFDAAAVEVGPLSDLVTAVKDNVAVRGVTMTAGTGPNALRYEAGHDAAVVERLRAAGAALVGTTNMDPLAFGTSSEWSAHGRTENPAADGYVPGGSSSGSAAAVAADAVDAAIGTDTGGSVRLPAAFCGVVGVKPTYDLIPRTGVLDLSPSNDHVGVLADSVETAARVLDAVAGHSPVRPETGTAPRPRETNLGVEFAQTPARLDVGLPTEFFDVADEEVADCVEDAVDAVVAATDAESSRVSVPEHDDAGFVNDAQTVMEFADLLERGGNPLGTGRHAGVRAAVAEMGESFDVPERVRRLADAGADLLAADDDVYGRTWDARRRLVHRTQAVFREVDVLVTPTAPMVAPEFGEIGDSVSVDETLRNTSPFNLTGQPSISLPCGRVDGRPVGLQLTAPLGADGYLLSVARLFESALREE